MQQPVQHFVLHAQIVNTQRSAQATAVILLCRQTTRSSGCSVVCCMHRSSTLSDLLKQLRCMLLCRPNRCSISGHWIDTQTVLMLAVHCMLQNTTLGCSAQVSVTIRHELTCTLHLTVYKPLNLSHVALLGQHKSFLPLQMLHELVHMMQCTSNTHLSSCSNGLLTYGAAV